MNLIPNSHPLVYGVGIGPGDPELITLKAYTLLQKADVVVYPASVGVPSMVRAIAKDYIPKSCLEICIDIPMYADDYTRLQTYTPYVKKILEHAKKGACVVMLCEGDPMFYGSFSYIYDALCQECRIEIVPGVSSISAAAALLGLPLSRRSQTLMVIPALLCEKDIETRLRTTDNAVIIKLGRHFMRVYTLLEHMNLLEHSYYAERIGFSDEKICSLKQCDPSCIPYFSLIFIKDIQR